MDVIDERSLSSFGHSFYYALFSLGNERRSTEVDFSPCGKGEGAIGENATKVGNMKHASSVSVCWAVGEVGCGSKKAVALEVEAVGWLPPRVGRSRRGSSRWVDRKGKRERNAIEICRWFL